MRRILVVPYDARWPEAFSRSSREVVSAMGGNLMAIHHIGSTSIPAMHAKPVIDMLAVVSDIAAADGCALRMESLGYEAMGEFGIPGRRYFRRDDEAGVRTHQVHTFQDGSPNVRRHLAFRDFMQAHPAPADQYAALKRRLADARPDDIDAYMDGKDAFIKEMEARALAWVASGRPAPAA